MGPPISTWPYSHPTLEGSSDSVRVQSVLLSRKYIMNNVFNSLRVLCLNFTIAFVIVQVTLSMNSVRAGPVILSLDYLQGPVPLARNIRHLPCISRRTGQEGLCMFAIDCLKANGSHLGTCIDRFYFGSCCQIPDKTILPQIIGNNIEDNSIDSANFVHPQTADKVESTVSKIPESIFPTRKPTTEKLDTITVTEKSEAVQDRTETIALETKSDDLTTIDNKIPDDEVQLTTAIVVETTTKVVKITTEPQVSTTDVPIKLSTFQTVSSDINNIATEKPKIETTEITSPTTISTTTQRTARPTISIKPTRKPVKPTYKPRPTYRPSNFTKPQTTTKPRPTKPISVFNTTRKPPYRPPPKRPTKKPLPIPPRLNITILPQSTSSRPIFSRPSVTTITYINTTLSTVETTTTTSIKSTLPTTISTSITTEVPVTISSTSVTQPTTTEKVDTTVTEITTPVEITTTEKIVLSSSESPLSNTPTEPDRETTVLQEPITEQEQETTKPTTDNGTSSSSQPASSSELPALVTWSNTVDSSTKAPEKGTTPSDEIWSPITPPEGWVLISTVPPKPATSSTTTTTTSTTTESPATSIETSPTQPIRETTLPITQVSAKPTESTLISIEPVNQSSSSEPTSTSSTSTSTTSTTTEKPTTAETETVHEFVVNVTLTPTVPTSTSSTGLTTFISVSNETVTLPTNFSDGTTAAPNVTSSTVSGIDNTTATNDTTPSPLDVTTVISTTTESINMSNYKDVCGRRLWPEARIVGGAKSGFGRWPWQISLRQFRTSTYLHKCGAALLNENWAITAAHCVEHVPPSELLVRLGEHDLATEDEPYGFAERRVQIVASHPHFDPATFEYDLALLRFYEPVNFQPNILPVCVPDNDDNFVGKTAYVTGWGRLYDEGPLPSVLQEVEVPVINNTACEGMYQAAGYNEHIPNIFICAGWRGGGADSCEGDSGGPMVVQRSRDGRFVLGGVISWGIGCAEPNQPGVYTRISEFRDWINQILQF